ncbi:MAG: hypothetical protein QUS13_00620 [Smithella sp.]|nr:hypothetical protein [Smithella sp.]
MQNIIKSFTVIIIIAVAQIIVLADRSHGMGIGAYANAGGGQIYYPRTSMWMNYRSISNTAIFAGGFMLDTNTGGPGIFNYRMKLGYDFQKSDFHATENIHRITITHVFGLGFFRNESVRIWAGPLVGIGYIRGKNSYRTLGLSEMGAMVNSQMIMNSYVGTVSFNHFNIHVGMALGININIKKVISLPIEGGVRYNFHTNFSEKDNGMTVKDYFGIMGPEGYASIGIMYRFNKGEASKEGLQ